MKRYLPLWLIAAPLLVQAADSPAAIVIAAYGDSTTAGVTSSGGRNIISKENEISYLHINLVLSEVKLNGAGARNKGIKLATGDYVSFLDAMMSGTRINWVR